MQLSAFTGKSEYLPPPKGLYKSTSVINRVEHDWQGRSRYLRQYIPEEIGRADGLNGTMQCLTNRNPQWTGNQSGTSIFDPCLAEYMYTLFNPKSVLDPFCGGPPRGYIAGMMGVNYKGFDVRQEQIDTNNRHNEWVHVEYICNSYDAYDDKDTYDMVFTCPPYADLEVYSKQEDDISNKSLDDFKRIYQLIIHKSVLNLVVGGRIGIVIGNYRKNKRYINLYAITCEILESAGIDITGDVIVIDPIGSKAMTIGHNLREYGLHVRHHQYLLIGRKL